MIPPFRAQAVIGVKNQQEESASPAYGTIEDYELPPFARGIRR
jgi:hypothetical protein